MNKFLRITLGIICLVAAIFCTVMTVVAIRFMEFGRMLFYGTLAFLSFEVAILAFLKLKAPKS